MFHRSYPGSVVAMLAGFAIVGWAVAWKTSRDGGKAADSQAETNGGARSPRSRDRAQARAPISSFIRNPDSARLFNELENLSKAAKPGEVNQQLVAVCEATLNNTDVQSRRRDFATIMELLRPEDAAAVHEKFLELHEQGKGFGPEYETFSSRWGEVDGTGAMAYLFSQDPPVVPPYDFQNIARGWARQDPQAALAWMDAHDEEARSRGGRVAVIEGWIQTDPDAATKWLVAQDQPTPELTQCVRRGLTQLFNAHGAEYAARWLADLPDNDAHQPGAHEAWRNAWGDIRELPYDRAATVWSEVADQPWMNAGLFLDYVNTIGRTRSAREGVDGFLETLSTTWPEEQIRSRFENWAMQDPARTANCLANLPSSPLKDAALKGLRQAQEASSPPAAGE